jgi:hypothetical protein
MPGVVLEEAVNGDNPLLQFFYQQAGQLTDVVALSLQIVDLTVNAERLAETPVTLTDYALGGARLGPGRYTATFTPTAADGWSPGTHDAIWRYTVEAGGPQKVWRQHFEVLDPLGSFASGAGYQGYGDSTALLRTEAFECYPLNDIHAALNEAARYVQELTGRTFAPRFISALYNSELAGALPLEEVIIGISKVAFIGSGPTDEIGVVSLDDLRIYNRHLVGLLSPDDRDNPRIEFSTDQQPGRTIIQGSFEQGRQNTLIEGVFGYTDFDGTPVGSTPVRLQKAVAVLALRSLQDPLGLDVFLSQPGRIKEARTRDQTVKFASSTDGGMGALTGDRTIDDILIPYMRPPQYFAVGPSRHLRDSTHNRNIL